MRMSIWEELNVLHTHQPRCTSSLVAQGSTFCLLRERSLAFSAWDKLRSAFLPEGYPSSVTSDYLDFQFWDTLQGLSTYIRSMLSTQALLGGIGVGETSATVIGATFQWFLRDFTGMLGGILFTLYQGSNLDSKAKQWRLAADFMNDIGMLMDLISPLFPPAFLTLLCVGSLARSVTGVASGATRAALTQHFALQQNAADISAKEGSQETVATLLGMLLGMLLAHLTARKPVVIWFSFLLLTGFHMFANYKAVRCLCLTSLNAERTSILLLSFFHDGKVLEPNEVSMREQLLPQVTFPKMKNNKLSSHIIFGARISSLQLNGGWKEFPNLINRYKRGNYLIGCEGRKIKVILHKNSTSQDFLMSFVHALVLSILMDSATDDEEAQSCSWMDTLYEDFLSKVKLHGWNTDRVLIHPGVWRANWSSDDTASQKKIA